MESRRLICPDVRRIEVETFDVGRVPEDGILVENPPADTELRAGDFLVVIGEDAQIRALEELDRDAAPPDALRTEC